MNPSDPSNKKGPFVLGAAGSYNTGKPNDPGRFVVIGRSGFLDNGMIGFQANRDLALNTVNWLSSDEDLISIRPKQAGGPAPQCHAAADERIRLHGPDSDSADDHYWRGFDLLEAEIAMKPRNLMIAAVVLARLPELFIGRRSIRRPAVRALRLPRPSWWTSRRSAGPANGHYEERRLRRSFFSVRTEVG